MAFCLGWHFQRLKRLQKITRLGRLERDPPCDPNNWRRISSINNTLASSRTPWQLGPRKSWGTCGTGRIVRWKKKTMDLVILPLATIWPPSPFCKSQWIKAFVSCILPNAGVCNNPMWIGHLSEKASPGNWDFARPTSVNSCHPFQVVKQQETWEFIFLPLGNLFCGLSRFIFRSQEMKIVISDYRFLAGLGSPTPNLHTKKRGRDNIQSAPGFSAPRWRGVNLLIQLLTGHHGNLQYLEDHPRYHKWLGSPQFISHKFRPVGRGTTTTRSLGDEN